MKIIIFLTTLLISLTANAGGWELQTTTDLITDKVVNEAFVKSADGERFTIIRRSDGRVWGYLKLTGLNQFGVGSEVIVRVDKNKPRSFKEPKGIDLEMVKKLNMGNVWEWNPSLVGFMMWHGKQDESCGLIKQLFEGQQMIVRYSPNQSTIRDITFQLTGNSEAISSALGFNVAECR